MSVKHLSDEDIQSFLDGKKEDNTTAYHIEQCEECRDSVTAYELLYSSLKSDYHVELSENFISNTMDIIRDDPAMNEGSASVYAFSIGGAVIGLLSIGYFIGFQAIFQYLGFTSIVQTLLSFEIINSLSSIITNNPSLWNTLGFAAVILLFFSLVERVLDRTKFGKLHTFSI